MSEQRNNIFLNLKFASIALIFLMPYGVFCQSDTSAMQITYSKSGVSISEIIKDLEEEYGIRFSYASSTKFNKKINVDFASENLDAVLESLLTSTDMEYRVINDNVLIRKTDNYQESEDNDYHKNLHIRGKVVIEKDKKNLSYATVAISNSPVGTYTDENGKFDLEIPATYMQESLVISFVGYSKMEYSIQELEGNYLLIPLAESSTFVEQVEIVNREKPIKISKYTDEIVLNKRQILNSTSGIAGSNINRNVQLLPGITAHNDNSSDIQVRGSSGDATLTILDGIPIYRSSHHYGIFSTINTLYIDSLNVYKNIFPIQFSGKTGGIVEMLSSQKPAQKFEAQLDINLLSSEAVFHLPISKNSSFEFSGKSTWNKVDNSNFYTQKREDRSKKSISSFKESIENNRSSAGVNFSDIHAKYLWRKGDSHNWSVNFYYSRENVDNSYETEISNEDAKNLSVEIDENALWRSAGASVIGNISLNQKWNYSTRSYLSSYRENSLNSIEINLTEKPGQSSEMINLNAFQRNLLVDIGQDHRLQFLANGHRLNAGLEINRNMVDYAFNENGNRIFAGLESIDKLSLYGSYDKLYSDKFFVNIGVRGNYFLSLKKALVSPRIQLSYHASDRNSVKASFSNYQQVVRQLYFEYRAVPMEIWVSSLSNDIPILQTYNYMIGYTHRNDYFSIDVEAYYRKLLGVVEYASVNPEKVIDNSVDIQDYRLFAGDGRVRGVDIIISSGYKKYDTYLSYTLSRSEEKYLGINRREYFPSENDRRHQFKWINSYTYNRWQFGLNSIFSSGRPYTNITNTGVNDDIRDSSPENRFNRLPAYRRIDISTGYTVNILKHKMELNLSVYNLLNTDNVKYIQSVVTTVQEDSIPFTSVVGGENSLLNRTVNVGAKIYFNY